MPLGEAMNTVVHLLKGEDESLRSITYVVAVGKKETPAGTELNIHEKEWNGTSYKHVMGRVRVQSVNAGDIINAVQARIDKPTRRACYVVDRNAEKVGFAFFLTSSNPDNVRRIRTNFEGTEIISDSEIPISTLR